MPQPAVVAGEPAVPPVPGVNVQSLRLEALQQRREMLADQYQSLMHERGQIGQERLNAQARGDVAMVREYEGVVARIGDRMQQIERSMRAVDAQIDEAMASGVEVELPAPAAPGQPTSITVLPSFEADPSALIAQRVEFQRMMVVEGAVLLVLAGVLWRLGLARGRRQAAAIQPARDQEKLQQSIDAIAIEVERLSEGQRFINNVMAGRRPEREPLPVQKLPVAEPRDPNWITPH